MSEVLFLKVKDTNFESNSQPFPFQVQLNLCCFWKSKIQILKAIHNFMYIVSFFLLLFLKVKDTNFESNSQHGLSRTSRISGCFWKSKIQILKAIHNTYSVNNEFDTAVSESQRYKFWKQFTTKFPRTVTCLALFLKVKDTNFESNSQPTLCAERQSHRCFWKSKIQILKAIHNELYWRLEIHKAVSESQRYKFWKQFTTYRWCQVFLP